MLAAAAAAFGGDFDFVAIKIPVQTTLELPLGLPLRSQLSTHSSLRGAGHLIKRGMRRIQFVAVSVVVVVFVCSTRQLKLPAVLVERFLLFSFPRRPYLLNPSSPHLSLSLHLPQHTHLK